MALKRCPSCGSSIIMAEVTYGANVEAQEDGTFKILQLGQNYHLKPAKCKCGREFPNGMSDLVEFPVCTKCGTPSRHVDKDGVCDVCNALANEPELANMSQRELLAMLLDLRKQAKTPASAHAEKDGKSEKAQKADNKAEAQENPKKPVQGSEVAKAKVQAAMDAVAGLGAKEEKAEKPKNGKGRVVRRKNAGQEQKEQKSPQEQQAPPQQEQQPVFTGMPAPQPPQDDAAMQLTIPMQNQEEQMPNPFSEAEDMSKLFGAPPTDQAFEEAY